MITLSSVPPSLNPAYFLTGMPIMDVMQGTNQISTKIKNTKPIHLLETELSYSAFAARGKK